MKKKLFIVIAALALVAALCGTLAACNDTVTDDMFRGGLLIELLIPTAISERSIPRAKR